MPLKSGISLATINAGLDHLSKHASLGTPLRFLKDGGFGCPTEGDRKLAEGTELVAHPEEARGGFRRFNGPGAPPDTRIDRIFGGTPPHREDLDDLDEAQWPISDLTGRREDPWQEILMVPLEDPATGEIFIFQTSSITGMRAVSNLLRQAMRQVAKDPEHLPVIKLRVGGFQHRKFGWVKVPAFEFVGKAPKTNIAAADTSIAADLDDDLPF